MRWGWAGAVDWAARGLWVVLRMPQSVAGMVAEGPASVPSRAPGRARLAVRVVGAWGAGWQGAQGWECWAAGPSQPRAAVSTAPPSVAAVGTAAWVAEVQRGGQLGAACQAVAVAACAGWRHSAQEALWTDHTAADFASVQSAGRPEGQEASLLLGVPPAAA